MTSINSILSTTHQSLFSAKAAKGLSFEAIAKEMGRGEVFVAAIFYGQAKPAPEDIKVLSKVLGIPEASLNEALGPQYFPERGLVQMPPTDPLIYRLYEMVMVYGYPLKALIQEKFGDSIMSAIDFHAEVEKVHENGADQVKIILTGKSLAFRKF